ncbi:hypothetical protein KC363_g215 [Hortaea werneckii]|nr:hypothetical protein KC363_g215 [Hortaea werneckii]
MSSGESFILGGTIPGQSMRDRSSSADFLLPEGVDDGGFACVGVADEADGDLFAVGVESGELAEEGDKGAFSKGVGQACVKGESRDCMSVSVSFVASNVDTLLKAVGRIEKQRQCEEMCVPTLSSPSRHFTRPRIEGGEGMVVLPRL